MKKYFSCSPVKSAFLAPSPILTPTCLPQDQPLISQAIHDQDPRLKYFTKLILAQRNSSYFFYFLSI